MTRIEGKIFRPREIVPPFWGKTFRPREIIPQIQGKKFRAQNFLPQIQGYILMNRNKKIPFPCPAAGAAGRFPFPGDRKFDKNFKIVYDSVYFFFQIASNPGERSEKGLWRQQ